MNRSINLFVSGFINCKDRTFNYPDSITKLRRNNDVVGFEK
jgi:hypothetical protein